MMSKLEKIRSDLELLYYSSDEGKDCTATLDKIDQILNIIENTNEEIKCDCMVAIQLIKGIIREDACDEDSISEYDAD